MNSACKNWIACIAVVVGLTCAVPLTSAHALPRIPSDEQLAAVFGGGCQDCGHQSVSCEDIGGCMQGVGGTSTKVVGSGRTLEVICVTGDWESCNLGAAQPCHTYYECSDANCQTCEAVHVDEVNSGCISILPCGG